MKYLVYSTLLIACIYLSGCGTTTKAYRVVDPYKLNKEQLSGITPHYSQKYKIPYAKTKGVDHSERRWGEIIDEQYAQYSRCVKSKLKEDPELEKLQGVKIIIVKDSKFKCEYHSGRCSGEYDSNLGTIFVSRKDFEKKGLAPLLKHEWSHVNGILSADHSNLGEVKKCTKY